MSFKFCSRNFRTTHFAFAALQARCLSRFAGIFLAGFVLSLTSAWSQGLKLVPTITTIAGDGTTGYTGDNVAATSTELANPLQSLHDSAGNLYFNDASNHRVRKVTYATGIITTIAGNGTQGGSGDGGLATAAEFSDPAGLAMDSAGNLYIADAGNDRIRKVTMSTGIISTIAGTQTGGFSGDGGAAGSAQFQYPAGLAFDSAGNLYINDVLNYRVRKITATSGVISSSSIISTVAGNGAQGYSGDGVLATSAEIGAAYGVAVDSAGNLYIADSGNNRIREVSASTGKISTIAGNGTAGFSGDGGAATSAELYNIYGGLALDSAGNVYIADTNNFRIRMLTVSNGIIDTIAGNGTQGYAGDNGPATSAEIGGGQRVEYSNGNIYIAQGLGSVIRMLSMTTTTFPSTQVGTSVTENVLFEVTGAATTITSFSVPTSQGGVAEYTVGTVTGCAVDGTTANPVGTVCTVPITFTPGYEGLRQEPLIAMTSGGTEHFGLNGTGVAPQAVIYPGIINTIAGTGTASYTGDSGAATSATLNDPNRVTVDDQGNVFISDTGNNVVREVAAATGKITTVAGNGSGCSSTTGPCGDGGAATSANLGAPTSTAVDAAGNLYISDTYNHRIRMVSANTGYISTVAGNGNAGYSGDGGAATSAELTTPEQVLVDPSGNLYIVDTTSNVVRYVSAATGFISTIAGNGTKCSSTTAACGDGGAATSAQLYNPEGIARDLAGNLYIADFSDNRIRKVSAATGIITTVAGTGTAGYTGDGGAATSANLNGPHGIDVDPAGNLYISDQYNSAVRMVLSSTGTIMTIAGNGTQCSSATSTCGDGAISTAGPYLMGPVDTALDSTGALYIADYLENKVRKLSAPSFQFATTAAGATSTDSPKDADVVNIGNESLTINAPTSGSNAAFPTGFENDNSSSCPSLTSSSSASSLAQGAECSLNTDFTPTGAGAFSGSVVLTDNSLNASAATQSIAVSGTGTADTTSTTVTSSLNPSLSGQSVTFTATIADTTGNLTPAGTVQFSVDGTPTGSPVTVSSDKATLAISTLAVGSHTITAVFTPSSTGLSSSTSAGLAQVVNKDTPQPDVDDFQREPDLRAIGDAHRYPPGRQWHHANRHCHLL